MARIAEKTRLNICAKADQPARPRRLISAFVIRYSSFFSTKKRLTNLNGEQNDTGNLLVFHRICHFRAIQPFDLEGNWCAGKHPNPSNMNRFSSQMALHRCLLEKSVSQYFLRHTI